jgi:hypothetical protein
MSRSNLSAPFRLVAHFCMPGAVMYLGSFILIGTLATGDSLQRDWCCLDDWLAPGTRCPQPQWLALLPRCSAGAWLAHCSGALGAMARSSNDGALFHDGSLATAGSPFRTSARCSVMVLTGGLARLLQPDLSRCRARLPCMVLLWRQGSLVRHGTLSYIDSFVMPGALFVPGSFSFNGALLIDGSFGYDGALVLGVTRSLTVVLS